MQLLQDSVIRGSVVISLGDFYGLWGKDYKDMIKKIYNKTINKASKKNLKSE